MGIFYSLSAVILLILMPLIGVEGLGLNSLFGIVVPYVALVTFVAWIYLPRLEVGKFSGPLPYSDRLRPAEIPALDRGQQH